MNDDRERESDSPGNVEDAVERLRQLRSNDEISGAEYRLLREELRRYGDLQSVEALPSQYVPRGREYVGQQRPEKKSTWMEITVIIAVIVLIIAAVLVVI